MKKLLLMLLCLLPMQVWATNSEATRADTLKVSAGKVLQVTGRVQADSIFSGNRVVTPTFSSAWTAGKRVRFNLADLDTGRVRDSLTFSAGSKTKFLPGSIFQAAAITPDSILGTVLATGIFNIGTASNFKLAGTAATFGMAGLNAVTDGSVLTTQHYHSALSASDGSPNPALSVDAAGNMGLGTQTPVANANQTSVTINGTNYSRLDFMKGGTIQADIYSSDTDMTIEKLGTNTLTIQTNGTPRLQLGATGNIFINETANTNSAIGLTINQGANDDAIETYKSSDVAGTVTTLVGTGEGDTYGQVLKSAATTGGLKIRGFDDGAAFGALYLAGVQGGVVNTTHTTAGTAVIFCDASSASGTGVMSVGAAGNIWGVANNGAAQLLLSGDGHLYTNDVAAVYDYADDGRLHDDVAMISTLDRLHAQISNKKIVDSEWENFTHYNELDLIKAGILGGPITNVDPKNRGLLNVTGLLKWHNGAIRQLGRGVSETEYRVGGIEQRLAQLEMRELFYSPTIWGRN